MYQGFLFSHWDWQTQSIGLSCKKERGRIIQILSPAFEHGQIIPKIYTCDGENISPPLSFVDVPPEAQSLALIMDDPDVPKNLRPDGLWVHWLAWNMSPSVSGIPEGAQVLGTIGQNTSGSTAYTGPCPPDREHRYFFKLYALDNKLPGTGIKTKTDLEKAMAGHILKQAELMGRYNRKTS